ncbi:hypothetical protein ACF0H5_012478 [Mactra antiquata]
MADSLDDGIILLNNDVGGHIENAEKSYDDLVSGTNPIGLLSRGCSVDESVTEARQHALKTAFEGLQKKHNKQSQKYMDLLSRNKELERLVSNYKLTVRPSGFPLDMEDSSEVHAAGGTSVDEAVSRANQGYVQHLGRELLITKNKLLKCTEENITLKDQLAEKEHQLVQLSKEKETVHNNVEFMKESYDFRKDADVQAIKDKLMTVSNVNDQLELKLKSQRDKIENLEQSCRNKDEEVNKYRSCLATAKSELQKATFQYRELQKQNENLDKENSALKATCKQYEIEVEICRKQKIDQVDESDDVDGDVAALNQALTLLSSQREEVRCLKAQVVEQSKIMHQRSKSFLTLSSHSRQDPMGAMSAPTYEEHYYRPQGQVTPMGRISPVNLKDLHLGDHNTGRKVNDSIQPTGNRNIMPMYAMESSPHLKRNDLRFTGSANVSPQNVGPHNNSTQNFDVTSNNYMPGLQHRRQSNSPRSELASSSAYGTSNTEYSNFSPRVRQTASPGSDHRYSPTLNVSQRPRNYLNIENDDFNLTKTSAQMMPNIPMRMTQSEIIVRDSNVVGETGNEMIGSDYKANRDQFFIMGEMDNRDPLFGQMTMGRPYVNDSKAEERPGPDYENVYVGKQQTSRKQPTEHEIDDNTYIKNNTGNVENLRMSPHDNIGDQVSVLHICPSCNQEFSRLTLDQFQVHVLNCFDTGDEQPATLQAAGNDEDRTCPMCAARFPLTIAQDTYEQHVLSHFNDDGNERFEMLQ